MGVAVGTATSSPPPAELELDDELEPAPDELDELELDEDDDDELDELDELELDDDDDELDELDELELELLDDEDDDDELELDELSSIVKATLHAPPPTHSTADGLLAGAVGATCSCDFNRMAINTDAPANIKISITKIIASIFFFLFSIFLLHLPFYIICSSLR